MKPDDSSVSPEDLLKIRQQALKALREAGALNLFPTPVADVMAAAKIIVAEENVLNESFLNKIRNNAIKFGKKLRSALEKVRGIFDTAARIVYIDHTLPSIKLVFLKLHETAHGVLAWQKDIYGVIEDCKKTLSPDVSEAFDREANVFASEVLFQLDAFQTEAADFKFGIKIPMQLSKKYGASIYSTIRRYVSTHNRCCAVLVLDPPVLTMGAGFAAQLRRKIISKSFAEFFGEFKCADFFTPDDEIGKMVPVGTRKMSRPVIMIFADQNGVKHECVAESFSNTYQVFILIHEIKALTQTVVLVP
jgi:Zn-dependent peptidase ImmA (M78 family)